MELDDSFWLATTGAATVATAISTGFTLWLQRRNRPDVFWQVLERESHGPDVPQRSGGPAVPPRDFLRLVNAGDGIAYRVEVMARGGTAYRLADDGRQRVWGNQQVPVVRTGESIRLVVEYPEKPAGVTLRVSWIPEPTRISDPVIEWIPLAEGLEAARTGRRSAASDWRYRELRWWQLLQRLRQEAARRARAREHVRAVAARKAQDQWREGTEWQLDPPKVDR